MYIWKVKYEYGDDEWHVGEDYCLTNTRSIGELEGLLVETVKSWGKDMKVEVLLVEFLKECIIPIEKQLMVLMKK